MATAPRPRDHKFDERRAELGEAALQTLATLGYARTSLREIAQNSEFSHGVPRPVLPPIFLTVG